MASSLSGSLDELEQRLEDRLTHLNVMLSWMRFSRCCVFKQIKLPQCQTSGKALTTIVPLLQTFTAAAFHIRLDMTRFIFVVEFPRFNGKNVRDWLYKCD
ncbi:unnamed protein product [Lathyrus sativus]|nr:unnamed protein product [Lathyrus sativus]